MRRASPSKAFRRFRGAPDGASTPNPHHTTAIVRLVFLCASPWRRLGQRRRERRESIPSEGARAGARRPMPPGRGRGGRGARVQSDDPFDFDTIETSKGPAQAEPADEEIADEENGEATPSTKEAMRSPPAKPRFTVSMHSKRRWGILVDEKAEPQPQRAPMSRRCFMLLIFTGSLTLFGGIGLLVAASDGDGGGQTAKHTNAMWVRCRPHWAFATGHRRRHRCPRHRRRHRRHPPRHQYPRRRLHLHRARRLANHPSRRHPNLRCPLHRHPPRHHLLHRHRTRHSAHHRIHRAPPSASATRCRAYQFFTRPTPICIRIGRTTFMPSTTHRCATTRRWTSTRLPSFTVATRRRTR